MGLVSFVLPGALGQDKKPSFPTNEQLRHFRAMANPRLSPDGKHVLVQITDATADGAKSHLWLIDVDGGEPRQLTYSPESDKSGERSGEWMPDGQSILFIAKRGDHTSLFQLPMIGGEAKPFDVKVTPIVDESKAPDAVPPAKAGDKKDDKVEAIGVDVGGYRVAPDGKTIALLISDPQTPGEKKQKDAKADAEWVNHNPHGARLYLLDVATSKLTQAGVPPDVRGATWSPDSAHLAGFVDGPNDVGDLGPAGSLWMVDVKDLAHPAKIPEIPATVRAVTWSADGRALVYEAQAKLDAPPGYGDDFVFDLAGKTSRNLTDGYMGSVGRSEPIALKDGAFLSLAGQGFDGFAAAFKAGSAAPVLVKLPVAVMTSIATNAAQNGWVFLGSDGAHPAALYYSAELHAAQRVLKTPALVPDDLLAVAAKRIEWKIS